MPRYTKIRDRVYNALGLGGLIVGASLFIYAPTYRDNNLPSFIYAPTYRDNNLPSQPIELRRWEDVGIELSSLIRENPESERIQGLKKEKARLEQLRVQWERDAEPVNVNFFKMTLFGYIFACESFWYLLWLHKLDSLDSLNES